jgi:hypothetical protein
MGKEAWTNHPFASFRLIKTPMRRSDNELVF